MGHPDWQTYPNWRGLPLIQENTVFPNGPTERGPFSVNNYQSALINVESSPDNMQMILQLFTDDTLSVLVDQITITFSAGLKVNCLIPLAASTLLVTIQNTSGGGAALDYTITPVNIPADKPRFYGIVNVISSTATSLPASTTANLLLPYMQPGLAHLFLNPHDATGKLNFSVFAGSPTARGGIVYSNNGPTVPDQRLIALSDRAYMIQVVNTDGAAAHVFDAVLIPASGSG